MNSSQSYQILKKGQQNKTNIKIHSIWIKGVSEEVKNQSWVTEGILKT